MKVYISVDMEGIAGIVSWKQDEPEHRMITRRLMTGEANAAIEGALAAGATEIVVGDSHNTMINLIPDELRPEARLVSGSGRPLSMVDGVDETFDGVVFVGYHSAMGTKDGVLDHTYSSSTVAEVRINGVRVGEIGINAGVCGYFGVPVVCVAGDQAAVEEAKALLGDRLVTVAVKQGIGRVAANSLHPEVARQRIREAVKEALTKPDKPQPLKFSAPVEWEIRFLNSMMAHYATLIPGAERVDGVTVRFRHDDYLVGFKAFRAMVTLAYSAL
ncbi:MAG: M55 family metallopeptidase [Limnochordales bacterium]|nr:peptidase M55 [Bacillota bacterium]